MDRTREVSLERLLLEEVQARPVAAYRLLERLSEQGWRMRIERGDEITIIAVRGDDELATCAASVGEAAVSLFGAIRGQARDRPTPARRPGGNHSGRSRSASQ